MIQFRDPVYLLLLIVLPILLVWMQALRQSSIRFSATDALAQLHSNRAARIRFLIDLGRVLALACLTVALARPQQVSAEREVQASGVDIVLALDISGSMLAEDFRPVNRMAVAKEEAKKFVRGRQSDRIGLVVFAKKSYTQCPLTLDYDVLLKLIDDVEIGMIKDGTAIGLGIANATNRLRGSSAKSKIIILLTDGDNNAGNIDPVTAAELAKSFGIKIYTIGIGTGGLVPFPIDDPVFGKRYVQAKVDIDETTLKRVADLTGGIYFPARDAKTLSEIYSRINQLEKSDFKVQQYESYGELFHWFLIPGLLILIIEALARHLWLVKLP